MAYFPIRWKRFTEFAAQSLVAVARGVRTIWVMGPYLNWPSEAWMGEFALPSLMTRGFAATLPNASHGEDIAEAMMEGLLAVAKQRLLVIPGLDARAENQVDEAIEAIHRHIGLRKAMEPQQEGTNLDQTVSDSLPVGVSIHKALFGQTSRQGRPLLSPGLYYLTSYERSIPTQVVMDAWLQDGFVESVELW